MGLAAPNEREPSSLLCRIAATILGGESSSRLFAEVRERRSLCYSVNAGYAGGRDRGMIAVYAGSTPERAHKRRSTPFAPSLSTSSMAFSADEFRRAVVSNT
jgi:predicted Zn-dependent peptidase